MRLAGWRSRRTADIIVVMANVLVPCPSCRRHVRAGDGDCRFCGTHLPADPAVVPALRGRLPRGAVFAFASTLAVAGCGGSTETETASDAAVDTGGNASLYGAPADTGSADGTATDTGTSMSLYGAPADAAVVDSGPPDTGGNASLYGAPADAK